MSLLASTLSFLQARGLVGSCGVVAVSGGADSVALAHVLARLRQQGHLAGLTLAHVNHRLRGSESDTDQAFVRSLHELWGMPELEVRCRDVDVAALAREEGWNLEDAGRRVRYPFFAEVARAVSASWVATGHTADDQAETVLLRLLRGTGLKGLAGIPAERPLEDEIKLIRPWLNVRRQNARHYLAEHGLDFREDATNQDARFARNRIRHELMPLLQRDYQPALADLLLRLAEQAQESESLIEAVAEELRQRAERPRAGNVLVFDADLLNAAPAIVAREMLRHAWRREGWPLGEMGLTEWKKLLTVAQGRLAAADFPGVRATRKGKVLQLHAVVWGASTRMDCIADTDP